MNSNPIDFSPLDPSRDPRRWEAAVRSVVDRGIAARTKREAFGHQLLLLARPALAVAASAALAIWVGAAAWTEEEDDPRTQTADSALVLSQWAATSDAPSANRILEVLGGRHVKD